MSLYEQDFYAWANETAEAILTGAYDKIDAAALADEVADMARKEKRNLRSRLAVLVAHLLKWDYQPEKRSRNWVGTVALQRIKTEELLEESPSLRNQLPEHLDAVYRTAVAIAVRDTQLAKGAFPLACPYSIDEILLNKPVDL
jgi:hypothetical protein